MCGLRAAALSLLMCSVFALHLRAETMFTAPTAGEPGSALTLTLFDSLGSSDVKGELLRADGHVVVQGTGFPLLLPANRQVSIVLLGVPTTTPGGAYRVRLTGTNREGGELSLTRAIEIRSKSFRHEQLHLGQALSDLRRLPSAEKEADARELGLILSDFQPGHVYSESRFVMPLTSWRETSGFGDRRNYEYSDGERAGSIHAGLDLAAPEGSPVLAAADGRVAFAGSWLVTGNTIVLEHLPGVFSLYYHLSELGVKQDELVKGGSEIGKVGMSGLATGPHLHWEVRVGGVAVDPRPLLDTGLVDLAEILHNVEIHSRTSSEGG